MSYKTLFTTVLLGVAISGCSTNKDTTPVAQQDPATFEKAKDPALKANTYFAAGQLAEERKDLRTARSEYNKALQLDPNHNGALFRMGYLLSQEKKYSEATAMWRRYLKATDGSADGYNNLAFCEELAGNPMAAEDDYRKGIARDPQNESCRVNFGLMLARHGRVNEGILQLQAVLTPAEVHYNLGSVYELAHRHYEARVEYQAALGLDPNMVEAKERLAALN